MGVKGGFPHTHFLGTTWRDVRSCHLARRNMYKTRDVGYIARKGVVRWHDVSPMWGRGKLDVGRGVEGSVHEVIKRWARGHCDVQERNIYA